MTTVTREELKEKMERGDIFNLVEALPEPSFREGHLPGAVNIPKGRERELAPSLLPDKTVEVIVYCSKFTWTASETVARALAAQGYRNVKVFAGGKQDWREAGFSLQAE